MPLDSNLTQVEQAPAPSYEATPSGALGEFARSFAYEGKLQILALKQLVGDRQQSDPAPEEASGAVGRHAQMFGRAAADIIPIVVTGIAVRYGFGKVVGEAAVQTDNILLKRSAIGLNIAESATTGLATGSLLRPGDFESTKSTSSLLFDRTKSGFSSALSFAALAGISAGSAALAERVAGSAGRAVFANPIANGLISGAPGGFINAQIDSLSSKYQFTTDGTTVGRSIYEMTLIGGVFGGLTAAFPAASRAHSEVRTAELNETLAPDSKDQTSAFTKSPASNSEATTTTPAESSVPNSEVPTTAVNETSIPYPEIQSSMAADTPSKAAEINAPASHDSVIDGTDSGTDSAEFPNQQSLNRLLEKATSGTPISFKTFQEVAAERKTELPSNTIPTARQTGDTTTRRGSDETTLPNANNVHVFEMNLSNWTGLHGGKPNSNLKGLMHSTPPWDERSAQPSHTEENLLAEAKDSLAKLLNRESTTYKSIVSDYPQAWYDEMLAFIKEDPATRIAFLEKQDLSKTPSVDKLRAMQTMTRYFSEDSQVYKRLNEFHNSRYIELLEYVAESPETIVPQLEALVKNSAHHTELDPSYLTAMEHLQSALGRENPAMQLIVDAKDRHIDKIKQKERSYDTPKGDFWDDDDYDDDESFGEGRGRALSSSDEKVDNQPQLTPYQIVRLANFLEEKPDENKALLERLVASDDPLHAQMNPDRLFALSVIDSTFGLDSEVGKRLLELERTRKLSLGNISTNLGEEDNLKDLIEKLIMQGAGEDELESQRVVALNHFNKVYENDPTLLQNILELEKKGVRLVDLYALAHTNVLPYSIGEDRWTIDGTPFIGVSKEEMDQVVSDEHAARTRFIKNTIESETKPEDMSEYRLESLYQISKKVDPSSELYQKILSQEKQGLELNDLRDALSPKTWTFYDLPHNTQSEQYALRPEFLEYLIDNGHISKDYAASQLAGAQALTDLIGRDPSTIARVAELQNERSLLRLAHFVSQNSERRIPVVQAMLHQQNALQLLDTDRLNGLETLQETYGAESPVVKFLLEHEPEGSAMLENLGTVVKNPIIANRLERMIADGEPVARMKADNIYSLMYLERKYEKEPEKLKLFLSLESDDMQPNQLAYFLSAKNSSSAYWQKSVFPENISEYHDESSRLTEHLLTQFLEKGEKPTRTDLEKLRAIHRLSEHFDDYTGNSPIMQQIIRLTDTEQAARSLREFIDEDPKHHTELVQAMIQNGATAKDLNYNRLQSISVLMQKFTPTKERFDHLFELEKQGLKLHELKEYLSENEKQRVPQITDLLDKKATVKQMNVRYMRDAGMVEALRAHFPNNEGLLASVKGLQESGMSASRLLRWIDSNPAARIDLVEKLISQEAGVDRFNSLMTLSVFPDHVTSAVLDSTDRPGNMSVAQVLGHLKNWSSGSNFRDMVIERVNTEQKLHDKDLQKLAERAREISDRQEHSRDTTSPGAAKNLEDKSAKPLSKKAKRIANILQEAAKNIEETIPKDQNIVLLGRDNWPLFPLLKSRGRDVQYFLWSRLQEYDDKTSRQWLKEVAPNSAVIDTGYHGSIINAIKRIDPSASGYLLSSSGAYPQLLKSGNHSDMVQTIEYYPKLIGRSKTYTDKGGAISKLDDRDSDELESKKFDRHHRWLVQGANKDMLQAMKLTPWEVWRFSEYVGLTPKERLAVSSDADLQKHYEAVSTARASGSQK